MSVFRFMIVKVLKIKYKEKKFKVDRGNKGRLLLKEK